jgi:phosphoglycolate phosphatase-like HAD superfamily hydrolase
MKLFVWDLHGTLEQGNEKAVIEMSNRVLEQFGYAERFDATHTQELYGVKWYEYFEHLLPYENERRHLELQAACFALSNSPEGTRIIANHMSPSLHALKVLEAIKAAHEQVLISNTTPESLPAFVKALAMEPYFDKSNRVAVNLHHHGTSLTKKDALAAYLNGKTYDDLVIIGDSGTDIDLVDVAGGQAYLYAHPGIPFRGNRGRRINDLADILAEL